MKDLHIEIKKLNVIDLKEEGKLFETIRKDDSFFNGEFGQNLVSFVESGIKKGFHAHKRKTEYLTCIEGNILFIMVKKEEYCAPQIKKFIIGDKNMVSVKIPSGIWHGYMSLDKKKAITLYVVDKTYNPSNPDQEEIDINSFGDIWNLSNLDETKDYLIN